MKRQARRDTGGSSKLAASTAIRHRSSTWDGSPTKRAWSIQAPATCQETEDDGDSSGFYKFVPFRRGNLKEGGDLYMLKVRNVEQADLRTHRLSGTLWNVEWVKINDPRATAKSTFLQGYEDGKGARFRRLEGAWSADTTGYFLATTGGTVTPPATGGEGQVFEYNPLAQTLKLIYNSQGQAECENPRQLDGHAPRRPDVVRGATGREHE